MIRRRAPQLNQLWGNISSQVAQEGAMGEHSSAHGTSTLEPFSDPLDPSRDGVGNVSKNRFEPPGTEEGTGDALAGGAQGLHAVLQGALLGSPTLPQTSIEAQIGPLLSDTHGNLELLSDPLIGSL
jgi:hypothetical protein